MTGIKLAWRIARLLNGTDDIKKAEVDRWPNFVNVECEDGSIYAIQVTRVNGPRISVG